MNKIYIFIANVHQYQFYLGNIFLFFVVYIIRKQFFCFVYLSIYVCCALQIVANIIVMSYRHRHIIYLCNIIIQLRCISYMNIEHEHYTKTIFVAII